VDSYSPVSNQTGNYSTRGNVTEAHWLFSYIPQPHVNGYSKIIFVISDNYNAQSSFATISIWIRPINDAPFFLVSYEAVPASTAKSEQDLIDSPYRFTFTQVHDIDFYDDWIIFTGKSSNGNFNFTNTKHSASCNITTSTIACLTKLQQFLLYCNSLVLYPNWDTSNVVNPNTLLWIEVMFTIDDLGNIDWRQYLPDANVSLSCTRELNITKSFDPQYTAITQEKPASSSYASIGAGVGVFIALVAGIAAALTLRKQKQDVELELASMLNNSSTASQNISPLYEPATVTRHSAVFKPAST